MQLHAPRAPRDRSRQRGQSLAEFALVLTPLLLILLGIIQAGLVLNAYVTVANAGREGARAGAIYQYDRFQTKAVNDTARAEAVRAAVLTSMGMLRTTSPQFANSSSWTAAGDTFTSGDISVSYIVPSGAPVVDTRSGHHIRVQLTYHLDLIVPLIAAVLPHDANGRMTISADVTMAVE